MEDELRVEAGGSGVWWDGLKNSSSSISFRLCHCFGLGMGRDTELGKKRFSRTFSPSLDAYSPRHQTRKSPEAIYCLSPFYSPLFISKTVTICSDRPSSDEPIMLKSPKKAQDAFPCFSSSVATPLLPRIVPKFLVMSMSSHHVLPHFSTTP